MLSVEIRKGMICLGILFLLLLSVLPCSSAAAEESKVPAVSGSNLAQWKAMSESRREHLRKLNDRYRSLTVEEQVLLRKKLKQFNELPLKMQRIILNNSSRLAALSEDDRRGFYRLIRKYRNLPASKKALVHRAFRKIKTLPKEKRARLFYLLLEEMKKSKPEIRKVVKNFLKDLNP
ncbi:DUF3106 domain-containing protein [Desulfomarina sp.]